MYTDLQICNLGLGKISASRIKQLVPPVTSLEVFMSDGYEVWKRTELTKRRWVFALEDSYPLTLSATLTIETDQKYKFALPSDCLRPVRQRQTEWKQRGRFLYSANSSLSIQYVRNVPETDFDPLFVDVLAAWIGVQACEYVTQSNSKMRDAEAKYTEAVKVAGQMNAFVIGPEDIARDDDDFPFVNARYV